MITAAVEAVLASTQDPAATETVRQGLSTGRPVVGSTRWWTGRPSRVQWRCPTPDVARPPVDGDGRLGATTSMQMSAMPTQKPPAGAGPATAMSPPNETSTPQPSWRQSRRRHGRRPRPWPWPRGRARCRQPWSLSTSRSSTTDRHPGTGPARAVTGDVASIREKSRS